MLPTATGRGEGSEFRSPMAIAVIDRAIEVFGGMGISDDTPLAYFYVWARSLRIADGPDAVHRRSIAREELRRERPFVG